MENQYTFNREENCEVWTVDLWSLKCKYEIKDPNNEVVDSRDNINCISLTPSSLESKPLIQKWIAQQDHNYGIDVFENIASFWPTIEISDSKNWTTNWDLWEYIFQITIYEYDQCNDDGNRETHNMTKRVCGSNFIYSEPYTVQKTPSGNLKASTDTLDKFKYVEGTNVLKSFSTKLNAISTSEYTPNDKVQKAMDDFIQKYEKLAVTVTTTKFDWANTVKKVPWKDIYFISGDVAFKQTSETIDKPFTIVQTHWNTTIKGNLQHNMMLLTKWNITFSWDCKHNQTVKWIFYAGGNLNRTWVLHNNNLNNNVWCTQWSLYVKWVLIWHNFNNLMKNGRSHLEGWFDAVNGGKNAKTIMNWANVVIEYSPSIFTKSTMPPGAEDFTTALSIYKY